MVTVPVCSGKWQALRCAVPLRSISAGSSVLQRSWAFQQREAKMHPGTGRRQVGQLTFEPDPAPLALQRGFGIGTAESRATV